MCLMAFQNKISNAYQVQWCEISNSESAEHKEFHEYYQPYWCKRSTYPQWKHYVSCPLFSTESCKQANKLSGCTSSGSSAHCLDECHPQYKGLCTQNIAHLTFLKSHQYSLKLFDLRENNQSKKVNLIFKCLICKHLILAP